jgi:hypothetical protein
VRFTLALLIAIGSSVLALESCGSDSAPESCPDGAVLLDGSCSSLHPYELPCSGKVVMQEPVVDCLAQGCSGSSAYAVCDGEYFTSCACSIPNGYALFDGGVIDLEAGTDGGTLDAIAEGGHS